MDRWQEVSPFSRWRDESGTLLSARMKNDRRAYKNSYYLHIAVDRKSFSIDGKTYFFQRDGKRKINLGKRGKSGGNSPFNEGVEKIVRARILHGFSNFLQSVDQYFHTIVFVKNPPNFTCLVARDEIKKEKFRSSSFERGKNQIDRVVRGTYLNVSFLFLFLI